MRSGCSDSRDLGDSDLREWKKSTNVGPSGNQYFPMNDLSGVTQVSSTQFSANNTRTLNHRLHLTERYIARQIFQTAIGRNNYPCSIDVR